MILELTHKISLLVEVNNLLYEFYRFSNPIQLESKLVGTQYNI